MVMLPLQNGHAQKQQPTPVCLLQPLLLMSEYCHVIFFDVFRPSQSLFRRFLGIAVIDSFRVQSEHYEQSG